MIYLTKIFHFHAAHKLEGHTGKCKNLHGHTYKLEVTLRGNVSRGDGMLIDFGHIKRIVKEEIIEMVDHKYLNDIFPFITTAENMAKSFFYRIENRLSRLIIPTNASLYSVTLWETETSKVTWKED